MGNSGAKSSGPAGSRVPGWRAGGGGDGRSGTMLYQAVGISLSSRMNLCWRTVSSMVVMVPPWLDPEPTHLSSGRRQPGHSRSRSPEARASGRAMACSNASAPLTMVRASRALVTAV